MDKEEKKNLIFIAVATFLVTLMLVLMVVYAIVIEKAHLLAISGLVAIFGILLIMPKAYYDIFKELKQEKRKQNDKT